MIHEYCAKCASLKEAEDNQICQTPNCRYLFDDAKSNGSIFVLANIKSQMKNIFEFEHARVSY